MVILLLALQEDTSASGQPVKYVSHKFNRGSKCLLTGAARTAEVKGGARAGPRGGGGP